MLFTINLDEHHLNDQSQPLSDIRPRLFLLDLLDISIFYSGFDSSGLRDEVVNFLKFSLREIGTNTIEDYYYDILQNYTRSMVDYSCRK